MKKILLLLLLAGCTEKTAPAPPPATSTPTAPSPAPPGDPLASFDQRTPVPLAPMAVAHQRAQMREHLEAVHGVIAGLARDDFEAIAEAARPLLPSDAMAAQCRHMSGGVEAFAQAALRFHETAGGIATAAERRDRAGVTAALGATLQECTSCHATYRQVVTGS